MHGRFTRNGLYNYLSVEESNALGDEHRSQSFVGNSAAFIGDSSTMSQCRLQMKYRGGAAGTHGNEQGDILIKSVKRVRRRIRALRSSARNKRPKQARKNQKRGTKRAGGLPERGWTMEERESLRGTLAVSQVARARAG